MKNRTKQEKKEKEKQVVGPQPSYDLHGYRWTNNKVSEKLKRCLNPFLHEDEKELTAFINLEKAYDKLDRSPKGGMYSYMEYQEF